MNDTMKSALDKISELNAEVRGLRAERDAALSVIAQAKGKCRKTGEHTGEIWAILDQISPASQVEPSRQAFMEHETIDFTSQRMGHAIDFDTKDGGMTAKGHLFHETSPRVGDFVLLANGERSTRYRLTKVEPLRDPDDMFRYEAEFAPRAKETRP